MSSILFWWELFCTFDQVSYFQIFFQSMERQSLMSMTLCSMLKKCWENCHDKLELKYDCEIFLPVISTNFGHSSILVGLLDFWKLKWFMGKGEAFLIYVWIQGSNYWFVIGDSEFVFNFSRTTFFEKLRKSQIKEKTNFKRKT